MLFTFATFTVALAALVVGTPHPSMKRGGMAVSISKRSWLLNADGTVSADALKSHVTSIQTKIQRGFDNYKKNTGFKHSSTTNLIGKRGASDPLTNHSNEIWYGTISVGTPSRLFTVDFDTGSSDLFLPSSSCDSYCNGHTLWDTTSSSSSKSLTRAFSLAYADGSIAVSGDEYTDTVSIVDYTAINQTLGAATKYSAEFDISRFPPDGLMGMAFQSISAFNTSPVFQTLVSEGQVTDPVFSFKLSPSSDSELYIGGVNSALYTGEFTYTPVTEEGFWQVKLDNVESNEQTILSNLDAIINTATTPIIGLPDQVAGLYRVLGGRPAPSIGDGYYTFPCDSFPTVTFRFGGALFPISASALNLGPVPHNSSECISGIVGADTGYTPWTIGDVFLRSVYTTFDLDKARVGFAQLA